MGRTKPWREVVKQALLGGKVLDNKEIYRRVAKQIGAKELTTNQKAKVRQQTQRLAVKPGHTTKEKKSKKNRGKWKYKPKRPTKAKISKIVKQSPELTGEYHEKDAGVNRFFQNFKTEVYTYQIPEDYDWVAELEKIAEQLEEQYGEVSTSVDFKVLFVDEDGNEIEQWFNLSFSSSPTTAASQAPRRVEEYDNKTEVRYHGAIERAVAFSFTLYVPI